MRVEKVINNNIISSRNDNGIELIAMGRGIGFGKAPGSEVEDGKIEKIFKLENMDDTEHFKELLASLPLDHIRLSMDIIAYARDSLGIMLNPNVYLTLTDHINFALKRYREGMNFNNALYDEVKLFYPVEYSVGRYALELIGERTGCRMTEDEAASIALHIVNGESNTAMGTTFIMIKMMREMMEMIERQIAIPADRNYPKDRLISDLKQLANRLVMEEPMRGRKDEELYRFVEEHYKEEYELINNVNSYIEKEYQCSMTEEEKIYLALNIRRMKNLYIC
ncbi:MAG: PRD domain-containing protein [Blautia sp.]|nr:PRD domain-containing protein [Lachnoclostridium sp.]MCM1211232.1 PRD domain-containing protein [Blautia sp.]